MELQKNAMGYTEQPREATAQEATAVWPPASYL